MEFVVKHYQIIKIKFFRTYPTIRYFFYDRFPRLRRVFKFGVAGAIATFADLFLLYIFHGVFSLNLIFSTSAAFILSFIISFILQKYWTFSNWHRESMYQQMFSYLMFTFFNLNINGWAMHFLVVNIHIQYLLSQIIVSLLIGVESYFVYKFFIFRHYENKVSRGDVESSAGETII